MAKGCPFCGSHELKFNFKVGPMCRPGHYEGIECQCGNCKMEFVSELETAEEWKKLWETRADSVASNQRKIEEDNTGYITQATRHSMLVSLSREINVISDENAVLYDTIIKLCQKFFPEKNNQKFCAQCKIMEKGAYAPNPIDDPTTPYIESHMLRLEMLATGNMELKDQIVKMCRLLLEEKDNDKEKTKASESVGAEVESETQKDEA